jgi:hypothetical protein
MCAVQSDARKLELSLGASVHVPRGTGADVTAQPNFTGLFECPLVPAVGILRKKDHEPEKVCPDCLGQLSFSAFSYVEGECWLLFFCHFCEEIFAEASDLPVH